MDLPPRDYASAPQNYTELFDRYRAVLSLWALRFGANSENVEDVVSSMFETCLRRDVLRRFDPGRGAKFGTYLLTVLRNHIRDLQLRQSRRPHETLCDPGLLLGSNEEWLSGRIRAALSQTHATMDANNEEIAAWQLAATLRRRLQEHLTASRARTTQDPLAVWDAAMDLLWNGHWSMTTLAVRLGVSRETAYRRLASIADTLRDDLAMLR